MYSLSCDKKRGRGVGRERERVREREIVAGRNCDGVTHTSKHSFNVVYHQLDTG